MDARAGRTDGLQGPDKTDGRTGPDGRTDKADRTDRPLGRVGTNLHPPLLPSTHIWERNEKISFLSFRILSVQLRHLDILNQRVEISPLFYRWPDPLEAKRSMRNK